ARFAAAVFLHPASVIRARPVLTGRLTMLLREARSLWIALGLRNAAAHDARDDNDYHERGYRERDD
ncbi:hypothetical protein, partial [Methylobacterium brachythecii]|uniref:hypothetical protein n=1 Tax=Methylobacterium brachythecii TaxID=1176177 RepID=UPI0024E1945C